MATEKDFREKRRSERVHIRVPIEVRGEGIDGSPFAGPGHTATVSRHGALVLLTARLKPDSQLTLTNKFSQDTETFRVVWSAEKPSEGRYESGIEALSPRDDFWGIHFPPAVRKA